MADRDPEVQALLDKKAIEETLLLFLRGCARADPELVERACWPNGWEDHGGPSTARAVRHRARQEERPCRPSPKS
jgi:hypothetical protein